MDTIRTRPSSGAIVMSLDTFRQADYGQLCARLGLKPSEPFSRADGTKAKRTRGRRRRRGGGGS